MLKKLQNKKGFTLMEMLIVVAIIAVLVAIAIPVFNGALTKSKEAADVANVRATYAEWQTAMLTENTKAPADKEAFLKGPTGNDTLTLNYPNKLTVADGTITYTASKLTDTANDNIHTQQLPHRPGRAGAGRPVSHRAGMAVGWRPSPLRESSPI